MKRFSARPKLIVCAWIVLFGGLAIAVRAEAAETLYLNDGTTRQGTSLGFESGSLRWQDDGGEVANIPLEQIDRIEYPLEPPAGHRPRPEPPPPDDKLDAPGIGPDLSATEKVGQIEEDEPQDYFDGFYDSLDDRYKRIFDGASDWTKRIELGARFLDGNTDEDFLNIASEFEKETAERLAQLEAGGQYGRANDEVTTNRWFANGTIDFNREGNWIVFVTSKNETDEFENLVYRGTLSGGLGYRFINEDKKRFTVRLGPGVTHEIFEDPTLTRTTPDLLSELEIKWPIFDRVQFEHKTTVTPSVEDFELVRINSNNGLLFQLDEDGRWSLKLGFRYEYNSQPNVGREPSDYTTSLLLVYTRK